MQTMHDLPLFRLPAANVLNLRGKGYESVMKMIITIVSNKDTENVLDKLSEARFSATRVSTTGLFLEGGHSCLFIGVEDSKVDEVFEVLQGTVTKRVVRQHGVKSTLQGTLLQQPVDVEEFGGVAFVIDVEEFKKF